MTALWVIAGLDLLMLLWMVKRDLFCMRRDSHRVSWEENERAVLINNYKNADREREEWRNAYLSLRSQKELDKK